MGSRKHKSIVRNLFYQQYKQLSIHERINFKAFQYWLGRQRYHLCELSAKFNDCGVECPSLDLLKQHSNYGSQIIPILGK